MMKRPLLTLPQCAERLQLSASATWNLVHREGLAIKLGPGRNSPVRVDEAALEAYLARRSDGAAEVRAPRVAAERRIARRNHAAECADLGIPVRHEFVS